MWNLLPIILFKLPLFFWYLSLSTIFCWVSTLDLGPKYYQLQDKIHLWVCCCCPLIQKLLPLIPCLSCSHGLRSKDQESTDKQRTAKRAKWLPTNIKKPQSIRLQQPRGMNCEWHYQHERWEDPHSRCWHPTVTHTPQKVSDLSYYQLVPAAYVMVNCIQSCFLMEGGRAEDRVWIFWQFLIHNCVHGPQSVWQSWNKAWFDWPVKKLFKLSRLKIFPPHPARAYNHTDIYQLVKSQ